MARSEASSEKANDAAWQRIVASVGVAEALANPGWLEISAETLKAVGQREPRLMAKWDTLDERPRIMAELGASLLPVRNGHYLIFRDTDQKMFYRFEGKPPPARPFASAMSLASFDTYSAANLSESQALDFAYLAGIFADFTGDTGLHLTLRGRLYSGRFDLALPHLRHRQNVEQVQIEIDAGYEGHETLLLIEAKRGARDHLHLRQLWYPYLAWRQRTRKRIAPVFFTYANGLFSLTELRLSEVFGEVETVRSRVYALDASPPPKISLSEVLQSAMAHSSVAGSAVTADPRETAATPDRGSATVAPELPQVPYPQANDLDKLIELVLLLAQAPQTRKDLASAFGFDLRQADYYAQAGMYLGLVNKFGRVGRVNKSAEAYGATPEGLRLAALPTRGQRAEALLRAFLAQPHLRFAAEAWLKASLRVEALSSAAWAAEWGPRLSLSPETAKRRMDGILRWLEWFAGNLRITP